MKFVRFICAQHPKGVYGLLDDHENIHILKGSLLDPVEKTGEILQRSDIQRYLPPVDAPNIMALGRNYMEHAMETSDELPKAPLLFIKATSSLNAHEENIVIPAAAPTQVDYEAELVAIIGKTAKNVPLESALGYVFGYTCGHDVSARDCQRDDGQWARAKSFDTFAPMGPYVVTDIDPTNLRVQMRVNGEMVQDQSTKDMVFNVAYLVSYLSRSLTLLPGTAIYTGTPSGVGIARKPPLLLKPGDVCEVEIEGIGVLRNRVAPNNLLEMAMNTLSDEIQRVIVPNGSVALWWLAQAGFVFKSAAGTVIYLDPYLSNVVEKAFGFKRMSLPPISAEEVRADWLVCSHEHLDHMDTETLPVIAQNNPHCRFAGSDACLPEFDKLGITGLNLKPGAQYALNDVQVFTARADHGDLSPSALSLLFDFGQARILFTGDTAMNVPWMQPLLDLKPDIFLPCINGRFGNLNAEEAAELTALVSPRAVSPCHFWMFKEHNGDPEAFVQACARRCPHVPIRLLCPGEGFICTGQTIEAIQPVSLKE